MAITVLFNGVTYLIPETGEESWGEELTEYFVAIASGALQKSGGSFTLTADVNFGANFGLLSQYYKTRSSNIATAGQFRLARTDAISWRNAANNANLDLTVDGSNLLTFNGSAIYPGGITALTGDITATGPGSVAATIANNAVSNAKFRQSAGLSVVGNASSSTANVADITAGTDNYVLRRSGTALGFGLLVNANVDPAAAIAYSKLSLTGSIVNADISASAAIVYSKLSLTGSIVNADVSGSAAIAYSKLNLASSIVNADVSGSAAIAYSKLNLSASIVNADIATGAAIAYSKLAALTVSRALVSDGSGVVSVSSVTSTQIGYLSSTGSNVLGESDSGTFTNKTIAAGSNTITGLTNSNLSGSAAISNANLASMANNTVKGNISGSSATPSDVAAASAATASTVMLRDTNANTTVNNHLDGYTTTATAAGTTTLTVGSTRLQYFTGATTQTVTLPVTSTLVLGQQFEIVNLSSGAVTVNSSGGNLVKTVASNTAATVTCILTSGTSAASWSAVGNAGSPLTTKGDLYSFSSVDARLPVGVNGQILIPDSNQTLGLRYQDNFPKNYILNSDAEVDTTGWATYADAAANIPANGTGGTATDLTFSRTTSTPLDGTASFSMVQANSTSLQGKGVSYDFSIDTADQAQPIAVQFNYNASSTFVASNGITAPLNDGTTTTNAGNSDIEVFIYDVTNSQLIYVTPEVLTGNGANYFQFKGTFQSNPNSTSYRLIFHVATTSANATGWTFKFDQVFVGRLPVNYGPPVTDWVQFTMVITGSSSNPTKANTTLFDNAYWRRVGDSMEIVYTYAHNNNTGAAAGSGTYLFGLPSGYTIDSNKISVSTTNAPGVVGSATVSSTNVPTGSVKVYNTTNLSIYANEAAASTAGMVGSSFIPMNAADARYSFSARVPIAGWSSNVVMSNDTDCRVVAASYYVSASNAILNNTESTIPLTTKLVDTHSAVSSNTFTVPVSGIYEIFVNAGPDSTSGGAIDLYVAARKNGVQIGVKSPLYNASTSGQMSATGRWVVSCAAGDTLDARLLYANGANRNISGQVDIQRYSGPASIATTDTIACRYTQSGGSTSSGGAIFKYTTKDYDTHSFYNTSSGIATAPASGKYLISATFTNASRTWTSGDNASLTIRKNSVLLCDTDFHSPAYTDVGSTIRVQTIANLTAGDTIDIYLYTYYGNSTAYANNAYNEICIERIGS